MNEQSSNLGERLRSLPSFQPPSGGWAQMQRKLEQNRQRQQQRTALMALAATVVLTLAAVAALPVWHVPSHLGVATTSVQTTALMARSRALESNLQQSRERVAVWDATSAARAAALQRELSIVDLQLSYAAPRSAQRLWRDRVDLLSNLLRTHEEAGVIKASYVSPAEEEL
jgi:hypothetical protein